MSRFYQMFTTKEEQKEWEKKMKNENENFKVCFRYSAKQLKKDLPFVDIPGYTTATIYRFEE